MRTLTLTLLITIILLTATATAQSPQTITRAANDSAQLTADFYPAPHSATNPPAIITIHMLNSDRAAYQPLIPTLHNAGYAILNIDIRGHGQSTGPRDWQAAIKDVQDWIDWLRDNDQPSANGLAIIGASVGANIAIISCAQNEACRGAIALSPGLDYRGLKPEPALVDGLADRAALLIAAHQDRSSSTAIRQMFTRANGDITARMFNGRAHGTRLFDSDLDSLSGLIDLWLEQLFQSTGEPTQ